MIPLPDLSLRALDDGQLLLRAGTFLALLPAIRSATVPITELAIEAPAVWAAFA